MTAHNDHAPPSAQPPSTPPHPPGQPPTDALGESRPAAPSRRGVVRGVAAAVIAGCFWGATGVFVRILDGYGYSPLTIVFVRMSVAFTMAIVTFIAIGRRDLLRVRVKDLWPLAGAGVASGILLNFFYSMSTVMNSLALASLLAGTAPVFVMALSAVFFRERITAAKVQAFVIVLVGCALTSGVVGASWAFSPRGVAIGLLAGLGWGMYSIMSRFALNRGYDSRTVNLYVFGFAGLAAAPFTDFPLVARTVADAPARMIGIFALHALVVALLPYVLYTYSMHFIDTGTASILVTADPVAAMILGIILYAEVPTPVGVLGIVLVLFGLALLNVKGGMCGVLALLRRRSPQANRRSRTG